MRRGFALYLCWPWWAWPKLSRWDSGRGHITVDWLWWK